MTLDPTATFRFGEIIATDPTTARVRVRLPDMDNLETAWLPLLQGGSKGNRHFRMIDLGEQVAVLLDRRAEDGVVLGSIYSDPDPAPVGSQDKEHVAFSDGTTVEYDRASKTLAVDAAGTITLTAASPITLTAPKVTVDGLLEYTQGLTGAGGATTAVITGTVRIVGKLEVDGDVEVDGDIDATGNIIDGGSNTNHHSH